jgi:HSP90 family molecular chaperone
MKKITLFQMFVFLAISGITLGQEKTISLFNDFTADSKQKSQSYIFYNAKNNQFVNFVLTCDIKTEPGGVAEILFIPKKMPVKKYRKDML